VVSQRLEPLWYQFLFHQTTQPYTVVIPNVTFIAGIATGKTTAVAASYMIDCLSTPYFRALNTSVTAKQAELPFEMIQGWIESNPKLEHLIDNVQLRPYPTIFFKNRSEWIFRTAGKDARFIRGLEFDRIKLRRGGSDMNGEAIKVLRGRLRGNRPDGRTRMVRLDVTTSPTAAPWLEERFNRGWKENPDFDQDNFLSLRVSTYMNTRLTAQMIQLMEAEYSDDMIDVELKGMFPITACPCSRARTSRPAPISRSTTRRSWRSGPKKAAGANPATPLTSTRAMALSSSRCPPTRMLSTSWPATRALMGPHGATPRLWR